MMGKIELKPCPICKRKMRVDYQNDQEKPRRGYYAVCDNCNLLFGLDLKAVDRGYCCGKYDSEEAVIKNWNDKVK